MLKVRKVLSVRRRGHGARLLGAFSFTLDLFSLNIFMSLILCSPGAGFSPQANNGKLPVRQGVVLTYWLVYLCYLFERDCCHWVPQTEDEGSEAQRGERELLGKVICGTELKPQTWTLKALFP